MLTDIVLNQEEILHWLRESDPEHLRELWQWADSVRRQCVGDAVHLRGLVEISSHCRRACGYCGLRAANTSLSRYRLGRQEILATARQAAQLGYGTLVMQGGEDLGVGADWLAEIIAAIKQEFSLAVTLSLGERSLDEYRVWKQAGADRVLLRFETSDQGLYGLIHPSLNGEQSNRIDMLGQLRDIGYEIGSGVMVGIPGQTYQCLAADIELFADLDLDMIGIGPFIAHPATPLGAENWSRYLAGGEQVPNSELMTYKVVALARLFCPQANIPATTALATINKQSGRELGLCRGANVIMPNLTPPQYRTLYDIYPNKACANETAEQCGQHLRDRLRAMRRTVGQGPGGRMRPPHNQAASA